MNTKRNVATLAAVLLLAIGSSPAEAQQPQWCEGTVSRLFVDAAGDVLVLAQFRGDFLRICNINRASGQNGEITATQCAVWTSLLKSAVERKAQTTIYYASPPTACAQFPTYGSSPWPWYVMLMN
jgi:hypothetical protein